MTKNFFASLLLLIIFNFIYLRPVFAHVLKTEGSVGAVIHIDPEDDPIAGVPANFYFEFKDREGEFRIADCDCSFRILENEQELTDQTFSSSDDSSDLNSAVVTFTFPKRGMYELRITGVPKGGRHFNGFDLSYKIPVERENTIKTDQSNTETNRDAENYFLIHWRVFLVGGVFLAAVVILYLKYLKQK